MRRVWADFFKEEIFSGWRRRCVRCSRVCRRIWAVSTSSFLSLRFVLASVFCLYSYRKDCCPSQRPVLSQNLFPLKWFTKFLLTSALQGQTTGGVFICTIRLCWARGAVVSIPCTRCVFLLIRLWILGIVRTVVFCTAVKFLGHSSQTGKKFKYWWFQHWFLYSMPCFACMKFSGSVWIKHWLLLLRDGCLFFGLLQK